MHFAISLRIVCFTYMYTYVYMIFQCVYFFICFFDFVVHNLWQNAQYFDHVSTCIYLNLDIQYPRHSSILLGVPSESRWLIANCFLLQLRMCTTLGTFGRFLWCAGTRGAFAWFCFAHLGILIVLPQYSIGSERSLDEYGPHEFPEGPLLADLVLLEVLLHGDGSMDSTKHHNASRRLHLSEAYRSMALKVLIDFAHSQSLVLIECFEYEVHNMRKKHT